MSIVSEDALIGLDAQTFGIGSWAFVLDERLIIFVGLLVDFRSALQFFDILVKVLLAVRALEGHHVLLHAELFKVPLNVVNSLLVFCELLLLFSIVVAEVPRVEVVILQ